jgi:hypothetical protein
MRWLPWAIWLVVAGLGVAISGSALDDGVGAFAGYSMFVLAFATVGALVASRRPHNPIGWILLAAGLSFVLGGVSLSTVENGDGGGRWETLAAWLGSWIWMVGFAPIGTFALLLFPDGRLPSRRWRPVAWLAGAGLAAVIAGLALAPGRFEDSIIENPLGLDALPWLPGAVATAGAVALLAALFGSLASLWARFAAARRDERLQLKWLLYASGVVATGVVASLAIEIAFGSSASEIANTITTLSTPAVPVAMGIAILRHRLYDIDLVIRRTLVYGALSATLAAGYLGLVLLAQWVIGAEADLAIAGSTLAMAALFRPLRSRIQAGVDRRFYRRRYDAALTLEAFSGRLREEVDLEALAGELRGAVRDTLQPSHLSLWMRP